MIAPPLACTVRDCGLLLERTDRVWHCARAHTYDIARRGYVNLLQPQDRKSTHAGDSPAAFDARRRLLAAGVGTSILDRVVELAQSIVAADAVVADLGCGTGEALTELASQTPIVGIGIDLSVSAIERAAAGTEVGVGTEVGDGGQGGDGGWGRRLPGGRRLGTEVARRVVWVVANADRRLPLVDHTVDLVLSVHGRRNARDVARVLAPGGQLLVAVPGADDLVELRQLIQGAGATESRVPAIVDEHRPEFVVVQEMTFRERHALMRPALEDLLRGTYRGARRSMAERIGALERLEVTLATDVAVLRRR